MVKLIQDVKVRKGCLFVKGMQRKDSKDKRNTPDKNEETERTGGCS